MRTACLFAVACLLAVPAHANTGGMTNHSTAPGCNSCHSGGSLPTVSITGPETLESGETASYTLTIRGGAGVWGGLNISVTNGAVLTSLGQQGTRRVNEQITHTSPKSFDNGEVSWEFRVTAPCSANAFTIFGAGNSTNANRREQGDRAGFATRRVSVTPRECPDAGILPDAGTGADEPDAGDETGGEETDAGFAEPVDEEMGCGCSSGGGGPGLLLAGFALALLRRVSTRT